MLDYGFRSRCCKAPISLGKIKKNNIIKTTWKCTKCRKTNIDIVSLSDIDSQVDSKKFSDDEED